MLVEPYILQPTSEYPLFITAKRYWIPEFEGNASNPSAQTLIVLHSTSFHKESWEPALEDLFQLASQSGNKTVIREAWAIDCPNHGESATLNRRALSEPGFARCMCCCSPHGFRCLMTYQFLARNMHKLFADLFLLGRMMELMWTFGGEI